MQYDKWTPTTYLYWAALLVITFVANEGAVILVACAAFGLALLWQLTQWVIIRRQRKAESAEHLTAWNYKG